MYSYMDGYAQFHIVTEAAGGMHVLNQSSQHFKDPAGEAEYDLSSPPSCSSCRRGKNTYVCLCFAIPCKHQDGCIC